MKKTLMTFTVLIVFSLFLVSDLFGQQKLQIPADPAPVAGVYKTKTAELNACIDHAACDTCSYPLKNKKQKTGVCLFKFKKHELECVASVSCK